MPKLLAIIAALSLALPTILEASGKPALSAMAWLDQEGQLEALTRVPGAGFRVTAETLDNTDQMLAGQIAFHTPTLLGGQAAKAGISCASCHVNGRDNPHFSFPGVSGAPGTADVTHSFFSSHRGDGQFNPVPIPDLAKPGKISRDKEGELEQFMRGLIVEEFDGAEPDHAVLDALAVYVRALCSDCAIGPKPITLETHLKRVRLAVRMTTKYAESEPGLAYLLLSGARHHLGLIDERFAMMNAKKERGALRDFSADLMELQADLSVRADLREQTLRKLYKKLSILSEILAKRESQSLYNPDQLAAVLKTSTDSR